MELPVTFHVTARSMDAWTAQNATSADAKVTSLATVRTLLLPQVSKVPQAVSRAALRRLAAMAELEASVTDRCNATRAADTDICHATVHKVPNATTVSLIH